MLKGQITPTFYKRKLCLLTDKRLVVKIARYVN